MLEWTGERFIPGVGSAELAYEHFARYLFAARLADGKRVLDLGCGEGYGAFLLSRTARYVLGVDSADLAIAHARLGYHRANLTYQAADAAQLPDRETFDLITCFEVIEHLGEEDQHALLAQVMRLLAPDGILLISTPNKPVYREAGDGPDYRNPYHVREMAFTEFRDLLEPCFGAILWIGQQTLVGNYLHSLAISGTPERSEPAFHLGRLVGEELIQGAPPVLEESKYFVAICAKERATLERVAPPSDFMLVDTAGVGDRESHATAKWGAALEKDVKLLEGQAGAYRAQIEKQADQLQAYKAQLEAQTLQVRQLRGEVVRREGEVVQRAGELMGMRQRLAALEAERGWLHNQIRDMQRTRFWQLGTVYWRFHNWLAARVRATPRAPADEHAAHKAVPAPLPGFPLVTPVRTRNDSKNGVRELTVESLPSDAALAVINDPSQMHLRLKVRRVLPFPVRANLPGSPLTENGGTAIVQLEVLHAQGAELLLVSQSAFAWLDRVAPFKHHLQKRYRLAAKEDDYLLFSLQEAAAPNSVEPWTQLNQLMEEFQTRCHREPEILDWHTGLNLAASFPGLTVFSPPTADSVLPYLDETVDIVAIASADALPEARRVARAAAFILDSSGAVAQWKSPETECALGSVSIVIPCHNGARHTENCLQALSETMPQHFQGEIIVVDDASTDETPALLERWSQREPRLKVLRNQVNAGFIESCNRGAQAAAGDHIVFLNNDTLPMSGWLPALERTLRDYPDAGAVGGKLILTDGSLQEAGGVIFSDGSAANFGRGDRDLDAPLYNFVRPVDYSSGACLATKRSLFLELGGFDSRYAPAYYEDVDYCFQLRAHGYRVYYQPDCAIIHFEGGTAGTDLGSGVKRYQIINQNKFFNKWRDLLASQPPRPRDFNLATWQMLALHEGLVTGVDR